MLNRNELFEKFRSIPYNVYNRSYRRFWTYREDLEQEGFLKLWSCVSKLDQRLSEGEQANYLYRAIDNCMHNYIFRRQHKHDISQSGIARNGVNSEFLDSILTHWDIHIDYCVIAALERALLADKFAFKRYIQTKKIAEEGVSCSNVNYKLKLFKCKIIAIIFRDGVNFDIEPEVYSVCGALRIERKR